MMVPAKIWQPFPFNTEVTTGTKGTARLRGSFNLRWISEVRQHLKVAKYSFWRKSQTSVWTFDNHEWNYLKTSRKLIHLSCSRESKQLAFYHCLHSCESFWMTWWKDDEDLVLKMIDCSYEPKTQDDDQDTNHEQDLGEMLLFRLLRRGQGPLSRIPSKFFQIQLNHQVQIE